MSDASPSLPALSEGDRRGIAELGPGLTPRQHKRRRLIRLADVVGYTNADLRHDLVDDSKIRNVERELHLHLARHRASLVLKRGLDIAGAAFALFLFFPLLSLVAVLVRATTPGPVIYSQLRHGLHGRPFRVYKFRTFYADRCDDAGTVQTMPGDQRITPIGHFLRRTNIDELPQLWNVLKGDMSLVGPRPHAIGMYAGGSRYEDLVLVYPMRHLVKPGITGLAQLRGFRGPTKDLIPARMRILCDLLYVQRRSTLLDLKIIVLTIWQELRGGTGG